MRGLLVGLALVLGSGPVLAASYGAIAIDDDLRGARGNGDYAVGNGPTVAEARRIAMSNCTLGGNVACVVKLTYPRCGAYASSHRSAGTGVGQSKQEATAAALASCGGGACHLVVADCVDEPLQPPR